LKKKSFLIEGREKHNSWCLCFFTQIDHSVVESFGGEGRACITSRVYPTLAINDKALLYAFNNGTTDVKITRLSAWSMKKAQLNGKL
jgi:beta-fructofuranosidase